MLDNVYVQDSTVAGNIKTISLEMGIWQWIYDNQYCVDGGGGVSQDSEELSIILALISYLCVFLML
jgi:hypothetical protein